MSALILLAEDHAPNRAILRRRLERRGFRVVEAEDGQAAVTKFAEARPDVVLMDLSMPKMGGEEALTLIRAMPDGAKAPVIALTAHALDETRLSCQKAGFDGFVTKPCEFGPLIELIEQCAANAR